MPVCIRWRSLVFCESSRAHRFTPLSCQRNHWDSKHWIWNAKNCDWARQTLFTQPGSLIYPSPWWRRCAVGKSNQSAGRGRALTSRPVVVASAVSPVAVPSEWKFTRSVPVLGRAVDTVNGEESRPRVSARATGTLSTFSPELLLLNFGRKSLFLHVRLKPPSFNSWEPNMRYRPFKAKLCLEHLENRF